MIRLVSSRLQVDEELYRCQIAFVETVVELKSGTSSRREKLKRRKCLPRPTSSLFFYVVLTVVVRLGKKVCLSVFDIRSLENVDDLIDVQFAKSSSSSERSDVV